MRINKKGFVYLFYNSTSAKFGATTKTVKSRLYFYNKNNKDKFKIKSVVLSKDVFGEENNFRWFLNTMGGYYCGEIFPIEYINIFNLFFGKRVKEITNE